MKKNLYKNLLSFSLFTLLISFIFTNKVNAQACTVTKNGLKVCAKDLNALYRMVPPNQIQQNATTVKGKHIIPPTTSIKDAPYKAAGNQRPGEPSDIVRQRGETGAKNSRQLARDKEIAAANFKRQQMMEMQRNPGQAKSKNCKMTKNRSTGRVECVYF